MTTVDRARPILHRSWAPASVAVSDDDYVGKHRKPGARAWRSLSLRRALYVARHGR